MLMSRLFVVELIMAPTVAVLMMSRGRCPNVPLPKYFDLQKFLGRWYSYAIFDNPYLFGLSCLSTEYSMGRSGVVQILETGVRDVRIFSRSLWRSTERMKGTARLTDAYEPAALAYNGYGLSSGQSQPNYLIADTDYHSYAVIYSCIQPTMLPIKFELAAILTRQRGVRPSDLEKILLRLRTYGIDTKNFNYVDQSNC